MRHITLQTLTWGTVAAAVSSALWLAASEPGGAEARKYPRPSAAGFRLVSEPSSDADVRRSPPSAGQHGQHGAALSR
jgi:hypothetical protein